jgi:hypothetical protein
MATMSIEHILETDSVKQKKKYVKPKMNGKSASLPAAGWPVVCFNGKPLDYRWLSMLNQSAALCSLCNP